MKDQTVSFPSWLFVATFSCLWLFLKTIFRALDKIASIVSCRPDTKKGIEHLQIAFSGMLVKDFHGVKKALKKSKRHLGNIPIISWLEGQFCLMSGNTYNAKSIFFKLSAEEKNTALGAYSLSQLAAENHSQRDALESVKTILKIHPDANAQIPNVIALCVKEGLFSDAFHYLKKTKSDVRDAIEGAIHYEKWIKTRDSKEIQRAFEYLKNIPDVAIAYADELISQDEKKHAAKILKKSFKAFPSQIVFNKFLSLKDDQISAAKNLLESSSDSWIANFEFAKILEENELNLQALNYFIKAYSIKNYDVIANRIRSLTLKIEDCSDIDIPNLEFSAPMKSRWICKTCHQESSIWHAVCPSCVSIASFEFRELQPNFLT